MEVSYPGPGLKIATRRRRSLYVRNIARRDTRGRFEGDIRVLTQDMFGVWGLFESV